MEKRTMIFRKKKKSNEKKPTPQKSGITFPENHTLSKVRDFCHHYAAIRYGDIFSDTFLEATGEMIFSGWLLSNAITATEQASKMVGEMSILDGDLVQLASHFQALYDHQMDPEKNPFDWKYEKKPYTGH